MTPLKGQLPVFFLIYFGNLPGGETIVRSGSGGLLFCLLVGFWLCVVVVAAYTVFAYFAADKTCDDAYSKRRSHLGAVFPDDLVQVL